jgi:hypothetical protein
MKSLLHLSDLSLGRYQVNTVVDCDGSLTITAAPVTGKSPLTWRLTSSQVQNPLLLDTVLTDIERALRKPANTVESSLPELAPQELAVTGYRSGTRYFKS